METDNRTVSLIHYWLVNMRGGEQVVEAIGELFPQAPIYTHAHDPEAISKSLNSHTIKTSLISNLPYPTKFYQTYLPFMPFALENLNLPDSDLVISSEGGPAKGIIPPANSTHICYCHSPMRYLWDLHQEYKREMNPVKKFLASPLLHYLRAWDATTEKRVDHFIANSSFTRRKIKRYYNRESTVIHPPVQTDQFTPALETGDYFLFLGELVHYKKPDLAVEAFQSLDQKLIVAGKGPQMEDLRRQSSDNVEFRGYVSSSTLKQLYSQARAVIVPGLEDFGIVSVEAQASGTPVIAYKAGGSMDTVVDGSTGILFEEQTTQSLTGAIERFMDLESEFDSKSISEHAERFNQKRFKREFQEVVEEALE